jgi:hypothetical protein
LAVGDAAVIGARIAASVLLTASLAGAAPASPTADSIVADYIAARGGLTKIRSIQTLRQIGRAIAPDGRQAVVTRELKRPGKIRFEFTAQGVTGVFATNGTSGWQVAPFTGDMSVEPMSAQAVADAAEQADIEGPLVDWKAKGHKVELAGRERVGNRDAYKLKVTLASGVVRYEYIDVKTHYEVRMETTRIFRGRSVNVQTTFGNHRRTNGLLFPCEIDVAAEGRPDHLRVVVDKVEINPPIADARFEKSKRTN